MSGHFIVGRQSGLMGGLQFAVKALPSLLYAIGRSDPWPSLCHKHRLSQILRES